MSGRRYRNHAGGARRKDTLPEVEIRKMVRDAYVKNCDSCGREILFAHEDCFVCTLKKHNARVKTGRRFLGIH